MTNSDSKMELRANIVAILNKYRNNPKINSTQMNEDIQRLKDFNDNDCLCKVLLKELTSNEANYANVCAVFAIEIIENEIFEKYAYDILEDATVEDEAKFFIISVIRQKGIPFDYDNLSAYIKQPEAIAHDGVSDFLVDAIKDPEVQMDLLDFYLNIPKDERLYLLNNLVNDIKGDDLANAMTLILQLDLDDEEIEYALNGLLESNSPYAIEGLEYFLKNFDFGEKVTKIAQTKLKEIKLANPDFKNIAIVEDSQIDKCYMSFVDGYSNFCLIVSRKRQDNTIDVTSLTINIMKGIVACIGFGKIDTNNFDTIIKRLFDDTMPINIKPEVLKGLVQYYYAKNKKINTKLPYEFIVWKNLLNDVEDIQQDISDVLNADLKAIALRPEKVTKLVNAKIVENWFYEYGQKEKVDNLTEKIDKAHITDINEINKIVEESIEKDFLTDKTYYAEFQSMLLMQAYAANLADLKVTSSCLYSMCFENPYQKLFINAMLDKSIYVYLANLIDDKEENQSKENKFKQKPQTSYTKEEIESLMAQLEGKWV